MPAVPHLLPPSKVIPARLFTYHCLHCDYVAAGASDAAAWGAMDAHARYVNVHADRTTDDHFEIIRLDTLIEA